MHNGMLIIRGCESIVARFVPYLSRIPFAERNTKRVRQPVSSTGTAWSMFTSRPMDPYLGLHTNGKYDSRDVASCAQRSSRYTIVSHESVLFEASNPLCVPPRKRVVCVPRLESCHDSSNIPVTQALKMVLQSCLSILISQTLSIQGSQDLQSSCSARTPSLLRPKISKRKTRFIQRMGGFNVLICRNFLRPQFIIPG